MPLQTPKSLGKALDFIHQSGLHLPCSKTNYPKVLLTDKSSYPKEIKNRWRRIENHSKTWCETQELLEPHFGPSPRALGADSRAAPLGAQQLLEPGHVFLMPAASKLIIIWEQGLAKNIESSTTSQKCLFGNSSGIPGAMMPGWSMLSCPLQQWHGEGQGKAAPRLGDMGQCEAIPPLFASAPLS